MIWDRVRIELLVFIVGLGTLGSEIAGARLLAPWFGASTIVWANTIAIVLVALSVGYAVGGRLADRSPDPNLLGRIVLVAAVLLAIVPFVSGPFLRQAVRAVNELSVATFLGSLVGVGVLLAIPLLLLGMVSPFALRLRMESVSHSGSLAGRLSAIGTVGSLTGTFLAALVLIPLVGTRRSFLIFATALAIAALLVMTRGRLLGAAVAVVLAALIALPPTTVKAASDGKTVIWEAETEHQYARVVELANGDRHLELNEGHAVHSVWSEGDWLNFGYWTDGLLLTQATANGADSVAILGNAAGTTARSIGHWFPDTRIHGVELDGELTEVGRELFDMQAPHLQTYTDDARPWLHAREDKFDVILMDAYRQPYIPFYLATTEFFDLVRDRLNPGGVVVVNAGHPEGSDDLEKALTATMREVFDEVWRDVAARTNTMLVATTGHDPLERLRAAAPGLPEELRPLTQELADRLEPGLEGGPVFTDDKAPVEWLIDLSLAGEVS